MTQYPAIIAYECVALCLEVFFVIAPVRLLNKPVCLLPVD